MWPQQRFPWGYLFFRENDEKTISFIQSQPRLILWYIWRLGRLFGFEWNFSLFLLWKIGWKSGIFRALYNFWSSPWLHYLKATLKNVYLKGRISLRFEKFLKKIYDLKMGTQYDYFKSPHKILLQNEYLNNIFGHL